MLDGGKSKKLWQYSLFYLLQHMNFCFFGNLPNRIYFLKYFYISLIVERKKLSKIAKYFVFELSNFPSPLMHLLFFSLNIATG